MKTSFEKVRWRFYVTASFHVIGVYVFMFFFHPNGFASHQNVLSGNKSAGFTSAEESRILSLPNP